MKLAILTLALILGTYSNMFNPDLNAILEAQPILVPQYEILPVSITVYHATRAQCDARPDILADGTRIDVRKAGSYRYCAVSRNLLRRWGGTISYGDTIRVMGAEHLSGDWIVRDTMNARIIDGVDLLVDKTTKWFTGDGQIMVACK